MVFQTQQKSDSKCCRIFWQGHKDLNPEPTGLETAALPIVLYPYLYHRLMPVFYVVGPQGFEPGTIRL